MRIFINEKPFTVADTATVADGLSQYHPDAVDTLRGGSGYVTDGVGRKLELESPLTGGAILRVIGPAGRLDDGEDG